MDTNSHKCSELKNAYIPMIVLHDLHIEHNGLSSQIDYLVITQKVNLVIEGKNLVGNIEVTKNGEFIRTTQFNGKYKIIDDDSFATSQKAKYKRLKLKL